MLPKIKVENLGTLGIKNKPLKLGVHFDRGFVGCFTTLCSVLFHPYFMASLVGFGGFDTINVKEENEQKKGIKNIKSTFCVCVCVDKGI